MLQQNDDFRGLIDGRYGISRTLGTGMSCKVYLARDFKTQNNVAIKVMRLDTDKKIIELM